MSGAPTPHEDELLHGLVLRSARQDPLAVALVDAGVGITYGDLVAAAGELALRILDSTSSGSVVGVLAPARFAVPAFLAVARAGCAYLPLDPALPAERIAYMLGEVDCRCVVVPRDVAPPAGFTGEIVRLDDPASSAGAGARTSRSELPAARPSDLAYVIFTSGSTGRPKAVGVEHAAAAAYVSSYVRLTAVQRSDAVIQLHSPSFDASVEEIWAPLAAGARVVAPDSSILDLDAVLAQVAEHRITLLNMVTGYWRAFVQELAEGLPVGDLRSVRHFDVGGEKMLLEDLAAWRASDLRGTPVVNAYGPTEAVVSASSFTITPQTELPEGARSVPIGKAFPGRRLYVLDEDRRPVELGETGELYVGGTQLARGYLNDAELTAERFVPDPFAGGGGRMYKTGDLVRLHPDGNLEFVGRNDDQIKLRGYRVELGEIAAALRSLDDVRDAAVVVLDETPARLGAGVVVQAGRATSADALTAALRAKLPAYMVPSVVEILPSLPVSPGSRKVDPAALRRLLAAPVGS